MYFLKDHGLRYKTELYYAHIKLLRPGFKFLTKAKPKGPTKLVPNLLSSQS